MEANGAIMAIFFEDRVTRGSVRAHPDQLYVFGENLERAGYERPTWAGEANAIGIPTKRGDSRRCKRNLGPALQRL